MKRTATSENAGTSSITFGMKRYQGASIHRHPAPPAGLRGAERSISGTGIGLIVIVPVDGYENRYRCQSNHRSQKKMLAVIELIPALSLIAVLCMKGITLLIRRSSTMV